MLTVYLSGYEDRKFMRIQPYTETTKALYCAACQKKTIMCHPMVVTQCIVQILSLKSWLEKVKKYGCSPQQGKRSSSKNEQQDTLTVAGVDSVHGFSNYVSHSYKKVFCVSGLLSFPQQEID